MHTFGYRAKTDAPTNIFRAKKDADERAKKLYGERNFYSAAPIEDAGKFQQALFQLAPLGEAANKIFEELKNTKYPTIPVDVPSEEEARKDPAKNDLRYKMMNKHHSAYEEVRRGMMDKHKEALEAVAKIKAKVQELENLIHRSTFPEVENVPLFVEDRFKPAMYLGTLCPEFRYF